MRSLPCPARHREGTQRSQLLHRKSSFRHRHTHRSQKQVPPCKRREASAHHKARGEGSGEEARREAGRRTRAGAEGRGPQEQRSVWHSMSTNMHKAEARDHLLRPPLLEMGGTQSQREATSVEGHVAEMPEFHLVHGNHRPKETSESLVRTSRPQTT